MNTSSSSSFGWAEMAKIADMAHIIIIGWVQWDQYGTMHHRRHDHHHHLVRASWSLCGLRSSSDEPNRIEHGLGLTQLVNCALLQALLGLLWGVTWLGLLWVARSGPLLLSNKPHGPIWAQANQLANWWVESWPGCSPCRAHREGLGGAAYCGPW